MDRIESILFAQEIASRIAGNALYTSYPEALHGDEAVNYVIDRLDEAILLRERAGEEYVSALKHTAKELDPGLLRCDPYFRDVGIREAKSGNFVLTHSTYARGELLQYEMPDLSAQMVLPKIGFYPESVQFPTICEGNKAWMSICPSEIESLREPIRRARGRVLTLGCGLGYYPYMIAIKEDVESITIVERQYEVIDLFQTSILNCFSHPEKVHIIQADAYDYVDHMPAGEYDMCFADIWEGVQDGTQAYIRLKTLARKYLSTEFSYWIEDEIRQWMLYEYGC